MKHLEILNKEIDSLIGEYQTLTNGIFYTPLGIGFFKPFYRKTYRKIDWLWARIIENLKITIQLMKEKHKNSEHSDSFEEILNEVDSLETLTWRFSNAISADISEAPS